MYAPDSLRTITMAVLAVSPIMLVVYLHWRWRGHLGAAREHSDCCYSPSIGQPSSQGTRHQCSECAPVWCLPHVHYFTIRRPYGTSSASTAGIAGESLFVFSESFTCSRFIERAPPTCLRSCAFASNAARWCPQPLSALRYSCACCDEPLWSFCALCR